ncbi:MAG: two-component sensor histidine kinase [Rhodospirillaceae bacterium TMED8]|nr:two-component sensor histidine kinase [Magnetovibrio sp.]OUT47725.1 MAG: two-component sensor histidine kinase [Rhodospirillaceae bacterium TMED8]|tara:strand:- start:56 stop:1363 length:1308 start_codon:yes stop_codon:yes gene_type:complete
MALTIKTFLPKSLLGRSLLIIVVPLILVQLVSGVIFFEAHWDKVSLRLARGVAGDIAAVIDLLRTNPKPKERRWILETVADRMQLTISMQENDVLRLSGPQAKSLVDKMLARAMREYVKKPFRIDTESKPRDVIINIQLPEGVLHVVTSRKRLFSSTTYVFLAWMVGSSLILFGVATVFMRNQVKPIRRLARAAEDFGLGREVANFKPEGAREVRQAAAAFMAMQERIIRHIRQRTDMLAGVSHDLRTPLTRMRLELEMQGGDASALKTDIAEMEHMLEGYLAFARGEGAEDIVPANLSSLLESSVSQARRNGALIDLHTEEVIKVPLRPLAFRRSITNILDNAMRYGDNITVRAGKRGGVAEIIIEDDGPGIPADKREDAFRPFYRLESSRNSDTGGVGLGLSIVRDTIRSLGGEILLEDSSLGGLRVQLRLPS